MKSYHYLNIPTILLWLEKLQVSVTTKNTYQQNIYNFPLVYVLKTLRFFTGKVLVILIIRHTLNNLAVLKNSKIK